MKKLIIILLILLLPLSAWAVKGNLPVGTSITIGSTGVTITVDGSNNIVITDSVTGAKTLAELATGGVASSVTNTPAGDISATDVQSALNELDTEKYGSGDSPSFVTITVPQTATASQQTFYEGSGDGTNTHQLHGQAFSADRDSYLPDWVIGFLSSDAVDSSGDIEYSQMRVNTIGSFASPTTTNPYTLTAANSYNSKVYYGATGEIDLPAGVDGMSVIIFNTGAFTITIDPNGSEAIVRDGTLQTGGVSITLSSGAGNFVGLVFDGVSWVSVGYNGTLAQGS